MTRLTELRAKLEGVSPVRVRGRVTAVTGLVLRAVLPGVRVGDQVQILCNGVQQQATDPLHAEVVGFRHDEVILLPLGDVIGVGPDSRVEAIAGPHHIRCGPALLGRVLDGLGQPIDGGCPLPASCNMWPVQRRAPIR